MGLFIVWFLAFVVVAIAIGSPVGVVVALRRGEHNGAASLMLLGAAAVRICFMFGPAFQAVAL